MDQIKIGKFIAKKRKDANLTQLQLANKLGVSDKSVSKWENGKCMPDLSLFNPLCEILAITVNDLMSGEIVESNHYMETLGENIVNMVSNIESKKKRKVKIVIITLISIILVLFVSRCFYYYCELDVKYDERIMDCEITDNELIFNIKGQSVWNTYHTIKEVNNEKFYFFHSTVNLYNKKRSNWEYFQSMARLLENKELQFGTVYNLDIKKENIKVYYTDKSIKEIEKADVSEIQKIVKKSYLVCESN